MGGAVDPALSPFVREDSRIHAALLRHVRAYGGVEEAYREEDGLRTVIARWKTKALAKEGMQRYPGLSGGAVVAVTQVEERLVFTWKARRG